MLLLSLNVVNEIAVPGAKIKDDTVFRHIFLLEETADFLPYNVASGIKAESRFKIGVDVAVHTSIFYMDRSAGETHKTSSSKSLAKKWIGVYRPVLENLSTTTDILCKVFFLRRDKID
jgi:hypothetical protein